MTQDTYLQRGKWKQWAKADLPRLGLGAGLALLAFGLSGIGMGGYPLTLALGLVCALGGRRGVTAALGSLVGYMVFWGEAGYQGLFWAVGAGFLCLLPGRERLRREAPLLLPAMASFWVSLSGLGFQLLAGDRTPVLIFLLRVLLAGVSTWLCSRVLTVDYSRLMGLNWDMFRRPSESGMAQVRLEIMAGVMAQTQQLLLEVPVYPIDEAALMARTRERACGSCPVRKTCTESNQLPDSLLHKTLTDNASLGIPCRKPARLMLELRRTQEQLRRLRADRERQQEYRQAVVQQYQFMADYLRRQSDTLAKRGQNIRICFQVEAEVVSWGAERDNGDKCQCFEGTGDSYYVVLCDGMGTGLGAADEAQTALGLLRRMLTAGFPADYALRSLNSLCCLRGRAGAVTVDLAEIQLTTGKVSLFKWGAAPSWLLRDGAAEKIGTAGPPPGLSVSQTRETVDRLSLRRGEALILMSDGLDGEGALRHLGIAPGEPLGEMAAKLLEWGSEDGRDDATVAAIRLHPTNLST